MRRSQKRVMALRSGRQMFERSEFLPDPHKLLSFFGNPPTAGKEFGRLFLHTLLWRDKRVWRRVGPQPYDLDFLLRTKNRRVSPRQTTYFSCAPKKSKQKNVPRFLPAFGGVPPFHSPFPLRKKLGYRLKHFPSKPGKASFHFGCVTGGTSCLTPYGMLLNFVL